MSGKKRIYLDNAATTALDKRVYEAMVPYLTGLFGNPSSIHAHGREVRSAVDRARRTVAEILGAAPSEIFFTSGATESINTALRGAVRKYGMKHVITSRIEHHAVLHTLNYLKEIGYIQVHYVNLDEKGQVDLDHLEDMLFDYPESLVALMYVNNEIGSITDIEEIGQLCSTNGAYFLCDTVQAVGHMPFELNRMAVHAIAGSAHKFHGPKGIGFLYLDADFTVEPLLIGGGQERNMRGGTENVYGIIGLARALELAYEERVETGRRLWELKNFAVNLLRAEIKNVVFNGASDHQAECLSKILNIGLPGLGENDMLLFNLDINGISVSGGSACASGTNIGSHVLEALKVTEDMATIRISFSKFNTKEEIHYFVQQLKRIIDENY